MKSIRSAIAVATLFTLASTFASELTRVWTLRPDESSALFAVPNGYRVKSVVGTLGEPTVMNFVTLVPVVGSGEVAITFEDGEARFTGTPSKILRERIRASVVNPEDVELSSVTRSVSSAASASLAFSSLKFASTPPTTVDYLILAPHDLVSEWEKFRDARAAAHPELTFAVKDLNEVYEAYPLGSEGVRNYAESIHKYLRSVRDTMGFSYVVLGGTWMDANFINENGEWIRNGNIVKTYEGNAVSIANAVPGIIAYPRKENEEIPSDMFYACLDLKDGQTYPWCKGDSTRYYESFQNEADRKEYDSGVDVVVSRFPLKPIQFTPTGETAARTYSCSEIMDAFIAKLAKAESADFSGTGRMGFSWGDFNYTKRPLDSSLKTENEFFDDIPNFFSKDRQTDTFGNLEMRHRDRIKDIVAPNYPVLTVDARCEHGTTWTKGLASVAAAQEQFLKTDHDFNVVAMHGWAGGSAHYHVEDIYNQTGLILFNDMSFPCETGWPDFVDGKTYVSKVSCGEATVIAPFGGSIASVNNTRSGWAGGVGQLSDQHNVNSYKNFSKGFNAGETWLTAHLDFAGIKPDAEGFQTSNTGGTGAWVLSEHILYGDPLVRTKALVDYAEPQSVFPKIAKNVALATDVTVAGSNAVVNATASGDVAFVAEWESADRGGLNRMKILNTLTVGGSAVSVGAGLEGGINRIAFGEVRTASASLDGGINRIEFGEVRTASALTGGVVELNTTERFYIGGVSNARTILIRGDKAILDCDNLSNIDEIVFEMQPGATNILRGIKSGALAGIPIKAKGGTILLESSNLFGGTTVELEGTTVTLGSDPSVGKLVASGEPFNATFTGSGIVEYNHGTELLKQWTIAGNVQLKEVGSLVVGFSFSGAIGANPTGWFTSWRSENFSDANAVLGPNGTFVRMVEDGNHHPYYALPSKKGFTLALYADLSKVTNDKAVMLSLGSSGNNNQILLMKSGEKIRVELAGNLGGAAPDGCSAELPYPGTGYHCYLLEKTEDGLSLYLDSAYNKATISKSFTMAVGMQVGSQYGGLKAGRTKALGMAVAEIRGYDAILTDDEHRALFKEFPAKTLPLTINDNVELNKEGTTATLVNSSFGKTTYLGGSNGTLEIPEGATVDVYGVKLNNTSRSADDVTMNVRGTLNILGTTTSAGVYMDLRNETQIAGIMLGHYAGTSALNVFGTINMPNADLLIGYTCTGKLTIDGGTVKAHGITNQAGGIRNDKGSVAIKNGGTLEIAAWPVRNVAQPGTMPIEIVNGTIRATGDWTCPWPITITDSATIDLNGHKLVFTGAISGSGSLTITDSSNGKGTISLLGELSNYFGAMTVDDKVQIFGVAAGYEGKVGFAARPSTVILHLTAEQMTAGYISTAWAEMGVANSQASVNAATVVFADFSGNELQSMTGTDAAKFEPATWESAMPYSAYGKDWSYIFIPQKGDHEWSTLANWRGFERNENGVTRNTALFTSGTAPGETSSNRWAPTLIDGSLFPEGAPDEGEFLEVHVAKLEGWTPKFGLFNGVHVIVDKMEKFQTGNNSANTKWLVIGEKSRMTIKSFGSGASDKILPIDIAAEEGLVFETNVPGITYQYNFSKNGSVKFANGLSSGTHQIIGAEMELSEKSNRFTTRYKKIVDFGEHAGAPTFTIPNTASIRMFNDDGTETVIPVNKGNPMYVLNPTSESEIGNYALMQDQHGLYLCYVDYDFVQTVVTVSGAKTNLDLNTLKDEYTERFVITGASGYFGNQVSTVELPVEFRDASNGTAAWTWNNGYSSSLVNFKYANGSGTLKATGTKTGQMFVFGIDSMFNGSIDLTGGNNRVVFGDVRTEVGSTPNSSITVERFGIGRIKRDGVWRADYITINGPVSIDHKATIDAKVSLSIGLTGAINREAAIGNVYYEVFSEAVADAAGLEAIKLYRDVWSHRLDKGETIRIIKNGKNFSVESFFPVTTTTQGDVTIYTANEVAREDAVAEINGVYYDTWAHALGAQRESGYSITVLKADALPDGYMVVDSKLVKAQVKIEDTLYQTFAEALQAANNGEKVITLLEDVAYELVFSSTDEIVKVALNGHKFLRDPRVIDTYVFALIVEVDAESGVTTYSATKVEHAENVYIDREVEGVEVRYWYDTVEQAFAYAVEGETVVLNKDIELNSSLELTPSIHLDFNGHKLTGGDDVTIDDTYYSVTKNADGSFSIVNDTYVWTGSEWTHDGETVEALAANARAVFPSDLGAAEFTGDIAVQTLCVKCNSLTIVNGTLKFSEATGSGVIILGANAGIDCTAKLANDVKMTEPTSFLAGDLNFGKRTLELSQGEIRGKVRANVKKIGEGTLTVSAAQRAEMDSAINYEIFAGTLELAAYPCVNLSYKGLGATIKLLGDFDISGDIIESTSAIIVDTAADVSFECDFESYGQNNAKREFVKLGAYKLSMHETPWTTIEKVDVKEGTLDIATDWTLKTGHRFNVYPGTLVSGSGYIWLGRNSYTANPAELHMMAGGKGTVAEVSAVVVGLEEGWDLGWLGKVLQGRGYIDVPEGLTLRLSFYFHEDMMKNPNTEYKYRRLNKTGLGTLELMRNFYFYSQLTIEQGALIRHTGSYVLGGTPTMYDGTTDTKVASDPTERVTIRAAEIPGAVATMSANGVTSQTDEMGVLWGTKVVVSYTAKKGYTLVGPTTFEVPRAVADETVGSELKTTMQLVEATYSLSMDGNCTTKSSILGGTALPRTGDDFYTYVEVRGSTTNKGAVPGGGKNGMYSNGNMIADTSAWSILAVVELSEMENGVLWSIGKVNTAPRTGIALVERNAGQTVALVKWTNGANPETILTYAHKDGSLVKGQHSYLVTFDGTSHSLFLDGVQVATTKTAFTYSMAGYQLGGVHGGSPAAKLAVGEGIVIDEFGVWSGIAFNAAIAKELAAKYPVEKPGIPTVESLPEIFGAESEVVKGIRDEEELTKFNEFLTSCNATAGEGMSNAEKRYAYQSFKLAEIVVTPQLFAEEPKLKIDEVTLRQSDISLTISLKAGTKAIEMANEKLAEKIRVGTSLKDMTAQPNILVMPTSDGAELTFTIEKPYGTSGFIKVLID